MTKQTNKGGRPLKSGEPRKQISLRLPVSVLERLDSIAEDIGKSRADTISQLIVVGSILQNTDKFSQLEK